LDQTVPELDQVIAVRGQYPHSGHHHAVLRPHPIPHHCRHVTKGRPAGVEAPLGAAEGSVKAAVKVDTTWRSTASRATRIALRMAVASERPWAITVTPLTPTSTHPPTPRPPPRA